MENNTTTNDPFAKKETHEIMNIVTAMETITAQLPLNAQAIEIYSEYMTEYVENHNLLLEFAVNIKAIEDTLAIAKAKLKSGIVDELQKYPKGQDIIVNNATLSVKEAGVKYDYEKCNDPVWHEINNSIEELTAAKKEREKFLKSITTPVEIVIPTTGEVVTVKGPNKSSITTYQISWIK